MKRVKRIIYHFWVKEKMKKSQLCLNNEYWIGLKRSCWMFFFFFFYYVLCVLSTAVYFGGNHVQSADRSIELTFRALVKGSPSFREMRERRIIKCLSEIRRYGQRSNYRKVIELFDFVPLLFSSLLLAAPESQVSGNGSSILSSRGFKVCLPEYSETHRLVYLINHVASLIANVKSRSRLRRVFF